VNGTIKAIAMFVFSLAVVVLASVLFALDDYAIRLDEKQELKEQVESLQKMHSGEPDLLIRQSSLAPICRTITGETGKEGI